MLCAFCALISNITILKIEKNENSKPSILSQNDVNRDFADNLKICATDDKAYVKIGGRPIGISIGAGGLIVVEKSSVSTKSGELSPCKDVDIQKGDVVTKVNGESVDSIYKLKNILKNSKNGKFVLAVERNDGVKNLLVQGVKSKTDGEYIIFRTVTAICHTVSTKATFSMRKLQASSKANAARRAVWLPKSTDSRKA